ncbi:HNH endonuclease [Pseudorhodoferax sp. Leaf274]|uniref:HNH endonuclease n=1 Tax=Pseudorhodoferax sp. Leaf274 TaxID=1736318 RepID=UPI0012E0F944|nr:HNH endonuclease [Pseudorhodoferax sp. Leaf274]
MLAVYDAYDAARGVANIALTTPEMDAALKQALHDAYDQTQKRRRLKHVREELFSGVELCPVCGIDPPTELDHVLPRSAYKAVAVYVRNLVPLCHLCNHHKLAGFAEPGELPFLHAYFDQLPDIQFLHAEVRLQDSTLSVTFSIDGLDAVADSLGDKLKNIHIRLNLSERYLAEVNIFLASQAISLHGAYAAGGSQGVKAQLRAQAQYEIRRFYRNHWRPTLLAKLSTCDDFCNGGFIPVFNVPAEILRDAFGS